MELLVVRCDVVVFDPWDDVVVGVKDVNEISVVATSITSQ